MTEDELGFAMELLNILVTLSNKNITVTGQAVFEKRRVNATPYRLVITNNLGHYTFDTVNGGPLDEVDITLKAEGHDA